MAGLISAKMTKVLEAIGEDRVVTAHAIGVSVGLCERSVYRYVDRLRAAGHSILSEAGMGFMKLKHRGVSTFANRANVAGEPAEVLEQISAAIDRYHASLTARKHGGAAGTQLVQSVQDIMGKHWNG